MDELRYVPNSEVPDPVRRFLAECYGFDSGAAVYVHCQEPNRFYILNNGCLQSVDFCLPPVPYSSVTAARRKLEPRPELQHKLSKRTGPSKSSPTREVLKNKQDSCLRRPVDRIKNYQGKKCVSSPFKASFHFFSSEWHRLSDSERDAIQRERRKANAYKTALCMSFKETGECEYGSDCCFAHGEKELRLPPEPHPKYKTQLCNKFSVNGYCPYGSRCQFIHKSLNKDFMDKTIKTLKTSVRDASSRKSRKSAASLGNGHWKGGSNNVVPRCGISSEPSAPVYTLPKKSDPTSLVAPESSAAWERVKEENKEFMPEVLSGHCTQATNVSGKEAEQISQKNEYGRSVCGMLEELFISDPNVSFSQSCFPRLAANDGWLSEVKAE